MTRVSAEIRLVDRPEATPIELELLLPSGGLATVEQSAFHDFTPHPWAGLPVSITLLAGDAMSEDVRAEIDLLRAELDLLKRAFRSESFSIRSRARWSICASS